MASVPLPAEKNRQIPNLRPLYNRVGCWFRPARHHWVLTVFRDCSTVVDFGGTFDRWQIWDKRFPEITLVNPAPHRIALPSGFAHVAVDACETQLGKEFDLAFSNSAIEHVGDFERQRKFAQEMLRLGRHVYCQTPNRWFPIEPHYFTLCLHWLPSNWFGYFAWRYPHAGWLVATSFS